MILAALLRAMRPQQWVKNVFVLAAVVFARGDVHTKPPEDYSDVWAVLLAFAAFCLGSSTIYLINDILDVESDRAHPTKCKRPIAAGELPISVAMMGSAVCLVGALGLGVLAGGEPYPVVWVVAAYIAMNFAYSIKLKHIVLVDAFCIATGFLFRVEAGGLAAHYPVSVWLMLCTLFLALFLALCKRRAEIELLGDDRGSHRANLRQYSVGFLDQMVTLLAAITIVSYTMYTVAPQTTEKFDNGERLVYTVPFVVFGLGRYLLLVHTRGGGGSPTKVVLGGDLTFVLNALAWVVTASWVVWS